jgi:hypothetical protein
MIPALSSDDVERRLSVLAGSLSLSAADVRAVDTLRTLPIATARRRPRRGLRLAIALAIAVVVIGTGNLAAAYYAPTYGQALAAAPALGGIARPLLQFIGLTEQSAVALSGSATSSGHTIQLVAGSADGLRTVILLEIDGRGLTGKPKLYGTHPGDFAVVGGSATLSDQFGHVYRQRGGLGPTALEFDPLVSPASKVGARLTLHISGLQKQWLLPLRPNAPVPADIMLGGDWTLHATLIQASMHDLPLPAPVRTADGVFSVTLLRLTGSELVIHWTVSGPINDQVDRAFYGPGATGWTPALRQLSQRFFGLQIVDANGQPPVGGSGSGGEWDPGLFRGETTVTIGHPGRYQLQLADALSAPGQQRWITVP